MVQLFAMVILDIFDCFQISDKRLEKILGEVSQHEPPLTPAQVSLPLTLSFVTPLVFLNHGPRLTYNMPPIWKIY